MEDGTAPEAVWTEADWDLICWLRLIVGDIYVIEKDSGGPFWYVRHDNPTDVVYADSAVMLAQLVGADFLTTVPEDCR